MPVCGMTKFILVIMSGRGMWVHVCPYSLVMGFLVRPWVALVDSPALSHEPHLLTCIPTLLHDE